MNKLQELPAGNFSDWLERTRSMLIHDSGMEVPCGDCCACCKSSYFIHIQPQETETMRQIPAELLFPAPGRPPGFKLMGYDQNGRCPMLINGKCRIYEYRPLTCRNYDCRVLTAAGVAENDESKLLINRQVRRWRFEYADQGERNQHAAVKAAAKFLQEHTALFPPGFVPGNVPQLAILAIQVYVVLLKYFDGTGSMRNLPPAQEIAGIMVDVAKNASNGNHLHF